MNGNYVNKLLKKSVKILLVALLLCTICVENTMAETNVSDVMRIDVGDYDEAEGERLEEYYYELGQSVMKRRDVNTFTMPHYYQNAGNSWDDDVMQTAGFTIADSGCCLTSFAMMVNYYKNSTFYNPGLVNNMVGDYACDFVYEDAGNVFGLTAKSSAGGSMILATLSYDRAVSDIIGMLSTDVDKVGYPVLVGMYNGIEPHYVVARGYSTTTSDVYIYDPDVYNDYYNLRDYYDDGYVVNCCIMYVPEN